MIRLPPRGPVTPMSSPTLLLVTEDHQLNMCYLRPYMPSLKVMKCSLTQPSVVIENQPQSMHDFSDPVGVRVCINASIGLGYSGTFYTLSSQFVILDNFCRVLNPHSDALSFISIIQRSAFIFQYDGSRSFNGHFAIFCSRPHPFR